MVRFHRIFRTLLFGFTIIAIGGCVTEEQFADRPRQNFEALWRIIDEHYCFFDYKYQEYGLDWNLVRQKYEPQFSDEMDKKAEFEVLSNMIKELRDGHTNLYAAHNVARYARWFDDYPANFSDSLLRCYLGRSEEYMTAAGLNYRVLKDNIGYVRCASFGSGIGDGNMHAIADYLGGCDGIIIDVRNNGGGQLTAAQDLFSMFINAKTLVGYMKHKTGRGHNDFSAPQPITIKPAKGLRWQKPVVILTNRRTYSAANSFVMYMRVLPQTTVIGDRTGGGSGMPFSYELPNGDGVRFSACPMYDTEMRDTEFGIDPDIHVDISSADYQRSIDTIIETAINHLRKGLTSDAQQQN